jgi:DNA end-binding protein Ku
MARAFWSGTLSFGLVEIPVRLHSAVRSKDLRFSWLDRENLAPVGYKHFNKETGEEIPWERIVRGYQYGKGEYVVLNDADFERANPEKSETIAILSFARREEIDPVFYDTPYYVAPSRRGSRSYNLLREALLATGRVGIARVVLRTREHLCAVIARDNVILLNLMRWAHELTDPKDLDLAVPEGKAAKPSAQELRMAERLIEDMAEPWKPTAFRDTFRDDILELVEEKVKSGRTHVIEEQARPRREHTGSSVVDLMPLLKKSLSARGRADAKDGATRHGRARTREAAAGDPHTGRAGARRRSTGSARHRPARTRTPRRAANRTRRTRSA